MQIHLVFTESATCKYRKCCTEGYMQKPIVLHRVPKQIEKVLLRGVHADTYSATQ